mmetsp:Transcript_25839/g.103230  ORF Transcript_25839/g.103230 Transcript_25839/m.103230 type:complete len:547 (-) Transcript_25839:1572-3212(-)
MRGLVAGSRRVAARLFAAQQHMAPTMSTGPNAVMDALLVDGGSKTLIGGAWVGAQSNAAFAVEDPGGKYGVLASAVPDCGSSDTEAAIGAATSALEAWSRSTTPRERSRTLRRWHDAIVEHTEELATLMTLESGKPLGESRGEVAYGASFLEWFAEEGPRRCAGELDAGPTDRRLATVRRAAGVAAAITPWNFPLAMITRKCGAALAAGCPVVLKPAEDVPLTALALAKLWEDAAEGRAPAGCFNVVTASRSNAAAVGQALCASPAVRALSFTGSTAVGKALYAQCAGTVKKLGLELGGNAPLLILEDADLDVAVDVAMASKFRFAGQTCVCADRVLVHDAVYDAFRDKLLARIATDLRLGHGLQQPEGGGGAPQAANIGPLINRRAADRVRDVVDAARRSGLRVAVDPDHDRAANELGDNFVAPAVVDVDLAVGQKTVACWGTETFGPVVPLARVAGDDDAFVALANDDPTGLAAYVVSADLARAWRVAERLEAGLVGVNQGVISTASMPFGGVKESGIGREGGVGYGIEEYLETQYLCLGNLRF